MTPASAQPQVYTDLNGLATLRGQARSQSPEATAAAAKQFEGMFIQLMLKSMRDASLGGEGLLDNDQLRLYQDLFDKQIAISMAERKDMGLAYLLLRQIGAKNGEMPSPSAEEGLLMTERSTAIPDVGVAGTRGANQARRPTVSEVKRPEVGPDPAVLAAKPGPDVIASREEFIQTMRPFAEAAGRKLGVAPEVLLAQSALESGWGRRVIRGANGSNSHNLFGIKAHGGWTGRRVTVGTLEYENGVPQRQKAAFRSYSSYAESYLDYADFIRGQPRYSEALKKTHDPVAYMRAIQSAGYATDPHYAAKVISIMQSDAVQSVKFAGDVSINSRG
jgi:flagellar protein FlgJ